MTKVLILSDNTDFSKVSVTKSGKLYILGKNDSMVPIGAIELMTSGNSILLTLQNDSVACIAFELGKIACSEKIGEVYTEIKEIAELFKKPAQTGTKKSAKAPKEPKVLKAPEVPNPYVIKGRIDPSFMNAPAVEAEPKSEEPKEKTERTKKPSTRKREISKKVSGSGPLLTEAGIDNLIKKNNLDPSFKEPIVAAVNTDGANAVTIDMFVRTKMALYSNNKEEIAKVAKLVAAEYNKR